MSTCPTDRPCDHPSHRSPAAAESLRILESWERARELRPPAPPIPTSYEPRRAPSSPRAFEVGARERARLEKRAGR